jgi:hypothetical protein
MKVKHVHKDSDVSKVQKEGKAPKSLLNVFSVGNCRNGVVFKPIQENINRFKKADGKPTNIIKKANSYSSGRGTKYYISEAVRAIH